MSDTAYSIHAEIGADDSGFQATFDRIEGSLASWGLDFDKLYSKGDEFFKGFGINIDQFAEKLGTTGPMLTATVGAAALVGEKLFEVGKEYDEAFSLIGKGTGAVGPQLGDLKDKFTELMGLGITQDINDVATGFANLSTKLDLSGEPLVELTKNFADFADVNLTSVSASTAEITDLMNKWNLTTAQAPDLLDQLTKASQMSGLSVDTLSGLLKTSGAQFQGLGLSMTDSISLLAAFGKEGVNTATITRGLNNAIVAFSKSGIDAATGLKQAFEAIKNLRSPTEALNEAIAVFGTRAGTEMANAIRSGKVSLDDFEKSISEARGTVAATNEETETFGDKMAALWNKIKSAVEPIASLLIQGLGGVISGISEIVTDAMKIVGPVFDSIKKDAENFELFFKGIAMVIDGIVHGDWEKAWLGAQLIVLTMAKAVTDALTGMVNMFIGVINTLIDTSDKVLDAVGLHIGEVSKVSITDALGITDAISKIQSQMDSTKVAAVDLGAKTKTATDEITTSTKALDEAVKTTHADYLTMYADATKNTLNQKLAEDELAAENLKNLKAEVAAANAAAGNIVDYQNRISEVTRADAANNAAAIEDEATRAEKAQESAAEKSAQFWGDFGKTFQSQIKTWNQDLSDIVSTMTGAMGNAFEQLGKDLEQGKYGWTDFSIAALEGLAQVLMSLGEQLASLAITHLVMQDYTDAALAAAGSVAAFIAAGLIEGRVSQLQAAATGSSYTQGATYLVGENGPELVTMPQGARIDSAAKTKAAGAGGNRVYNIYAPQARSAAEIAREVRKSDRVSAFMGGIG